MSRFEITRIARNSVVITLLLFVTTSPHPASARVEDSGAFPLAVSTGDVFIMLQTDPDESTGSFTLDHTFGTNSSPAIASPFTLTDIQNLQVFNSVNAGVYTVSLQPTTGWQVVASGDGYDTGCWDDQGNSTIDVSTGVATINVGAGEWVACTFVVAVRTVTAEPDPVDGGTQPLLDRPRGMGYWKNWVACPSDAGAAALSTREAALARRSLKRGSMLYPVGGVDGMTCAQAMHLLNRQDFNGAQKSSDAAYNLASQLVTAKLNRAAGAPVSSCAAAAINSANQLLASLSFSGTGDYLGPRSSSPLRNTALSLAGQLGRYNDGGSC